ncbi:MAG: hypothetical protein ACT4PL_02845 [Phycisphaerales bacterium]
MMRKRGVPVFVELLRAKTSREHVTREAERAAASPVPVVRIAPMGVPEGAAEVAAGTPSSSTLPAAPFETPAIASTPPLRLANAGVVRPHSIPRIEGAVEPKVSATVIPAPLDDGEPGVLGISRSGWLWLAGGVLALAVVWYIAYSLGQGDGETRRSDAASKLLEDDRARVADRASGAGSGTVSPPQNNQKPSPTPPSPSPDDPRKSAAEKPKPAPREAPVEPTKPGPVVGRLVVGHNYLIVATLMRPDADETARFLTENSVPVAVIPSDGIDPSDPRVNNPQFQWQVAVLKGFADYRRTETERLALVTEIQKLGRKWKTTNRKAPTDFSQVFWQKYKGP